VSGSWSRCSLGDLFEIENGFAFKSADFQAAGVPVIKIKNIKANHFAEGEHSFVSPRFMEERPSKVARRGDLLISMSGNRHDGSPETWVGKVAPFNQVRIFLINQRVGALRPKSRSDLSTRYFGYLLSSWPFQEHFISVATSSGGQANLSPKQILSVPVEFPPLPEQRAIAATLGALDDKIELNRKMNATLEAMARALFRDWFVDFGPTRTKIEGHAPYLSPELWPLFPDRLDAEGNPEGWEEKPLDEIANFLNGLALQKFPGEGEPNSLPVIKIAELRNGVTDKSNRASRKVPPQYVIEDGDFLFSWSGSLLAKFWTGGEGALNQHLFKVSSERYPAWFFSEWVQHHLKEFQIIAASKATTMGHIQRGHLKAAMTTCPPEDVIHKMEAVMAPMIDRIIHNELESRTLAQTRDLLLPRLMSGELRVTETEQPVAITA